MFAFFFAFASSFSEFSFISTRGNWSISHELVEPSLNSNGNYTTYIDTYWANVTEISMSFVKVEIYRNQEDLSKPLLAFQLQTREKYIIFTENNQNHNYFFNDGTSHQVTISGKYHQYTFHWILAQNSRYQLSAFDEEKKVWHFFNIIHNIDRSEPSFWKQQFWTLFGMFSFSICFSVLYIMHYKKFNQEFAEKRKQQAQEKLLPKPEFEDVLGQTSIRQRTNGPKQ